MKIFGLGIALTLVFLASSAGPLAAEPRANSAATDDDAVEAYQAYWSSFNQYERNKLAREKNSFDGKWGELRDKYLLKSKQLNSKQIETLTAAAAEYKEHMSSFPNATNRANVMLNYARVLSILGELQLAASNEQQARFKQQEAIAVLQEIESTFPAFDEIEKTMYLHAIILTDLGIETQANDEWEKLASKAKNSLYGVHAQLALGDRSFSLSKPKVALNYYLAGLKLLNSIEPSDKDVEMARVHYRIAWAAYRAGEFDSAVLSAIELLQPGLRTLSLEAAAQMKKDSIEIISDALYEQNDESAIKKAFAKRVIAESVGAIAKEMALRYSAAGIYRRVASITELAVQSAPVSPQAPELFALQAAAFQSLGQAESRNGSLERLAMLLPSKSLWRLKNKDSPEAVVKLNQLGKDAAIALSSYYYDKALASGHLASYQSASAQFETLISEFPLDDSANTWRLRRAHCFLFTDKPAQAADLYAELIQSFRLNQNDLEMASYQLAIARERILRKELSRSSTANSAADSPTGEKLTEFEMAVGQFASKFPDSQRACDLTLMAASANRDQEKFDRAQTHWRNLLSMKPTPVQRATAIRGIVFAVVKTGSPLDVVTASENFLRLENWKTVGQYVETELLGVLSSAAQDESARLNESGQIRNGGALLVRIAQQYPGIPERAKIYRDGAFMLALASDWRAAGASSSAFLKQKLSPYADDMMYLKGRAEEFQMNFESASTVYIELAKRYPKHARTLSSLTRSERLSVADDRNAVAGQAAALIGDLENDRGRKLAAYERAANYYVSADQATLASSAAAMYEKSAVTDAEKMRGQLLLARVSIDSNRDATKALARVNSVVKKSAAARGKDLSEEDSKKISSEANLLLAEEAKRAFEDFDIFERSGSLNDRLAQKSKLFEALVNNYSAAAALDHPDVAPKARYQVAESAEAFARQISEIPSRSQESMSYRMRQRMTDNVKRLNEITRKYHTQNMVARSKNPVLYKSNEWALKSSRKLSDFGTDPGDSRHPEELPSAISMEIPFQWSL